MSWIPAFTDKIEHPIPINNLLKSKQATPSHPPRPITISIVGAGQRGSGYAYYTILEPQWAKVVAVAEPVDIRRNRMVKLYNIPEENVFKDWKEMIDRPKLSDAVVIATLDDLHVEPAVAFANKKYNILLEKPMAITVEGCKKITKAVTENKIIFAVGHVLRYTPHNILIKSIIDSGFIGNIVNIQHMEPVGFWHFAHSYVRGNWRKEEESCFSLMTKCCHDIDLMSYWNNSPCKISSFGNLVYFNSKNKPKDAGDATNCLECKIEPTCPYSAKKIYIDNGYKKGVISWPVSVVTDITDIENLTNAIKNGPYGRCVYECDNDVADNQIVNLEFANGSTANITMIAYTETVCKRKTKIFGTLGEIEGDGINTVMYYNFLTRKKELLKPSEILGVKGLGGHAGGDLALMRAFIYSIGESLFDLRDINSLHVKTDSHLFVFAAEHSRKTGKTINIEDFKKMWEIS
ncbi:putative oxidoreductase YteT-like protein [Gigaspora rosea]|uniref:Putative oxidoreductase YteT-like protein n=1 Tax=Gigaspora rosea TaxID=44941 RepID=A0A397VD26_9GLOM|nr:putative oxidoreductase YteT-like protein [Gigaspora rosea]